MRLGVMVLALTGLAAGHARAASYELKATPETVVVGYYWSQAKPVLKIQSGDTVKIQTATGGAARAIAAGVPKEQIPEAFDRIGKEVKDRGPGGHTLTGPVYVEGAEPGDVLEVRIQKIDLGVPYAMNAFRPTAGFLEEDFPYSRSKTIKLDEKRMMGIFGNGIEIPLKPFFGSMGVAPPESAGRYNSAPPWIHGGNMDNKEFVAGTTLYLPVHVKGALFEVGDAHAGQGDGEVDIQAMETSLVGTFQFVVRKDMHLTWPRGETATHYIVMGMDEELAIATRIAVREMIDFLVTQKGMNKDDAYMLTSVAADFHITQLVDGKKGVHGMILKSIFPPSSAAKN
ncbi:MAG TPA: acetamidase/formamidase family protein [Bryobacteraceae bacterium]|nr:acetamidase/formamidase family protein [Bryobacteraceae bacterium]